MKNKNFICCRVGAKKKVILRDRKKSFVCCEFKELERTGEEIFLSVDTCWSRVREKKFLCNYTEIVEERKCERVEGVVNKQKKM